MIQKVIKRKMEERVKIKTTRPKMEDRNFTNPPKIGFPEYFSPTAFANRFMAYYSSNEISPNLHSKFQLGGKAVN
jgi:hypothetical protein